METEFKQYSLSPFGAKGHQGLRLELGPLNSSYPVTLPSTKLRHLEMTLRGEERISDGPALLPQVGLSLGSCQGGRGGSSGSGGGALGVVTAERVLVVQECGNCG